MSKGRLIPTITVEEEAFQRLCNYVITAMASSGHVTSLLT